MSEEGAVAGSGRRRRPAGRRRTTHTAFRLYRASSSEIAAATRSGASSGT